MTPCITHKILEGKRIVFLRQPSENQAAVELVLRHGGLPIHYPIIATRGTAQLAMVTPAFLQPFDTIIFASVNAIEYFLRQLQTDPVKISALLRQKHIVPVGKATATHLLALGIQPEPIPAEFNQEGILKALPSNLKQRRILLPNHQASRTTLEQGLIDRGAEVTVLPIYESYPCTRKSKVPWQAGDFILFSSSLMVKFFFETHEAYETQMLSNLITAVSIGPSTQTTLQTYFNGPCLMAKEALIIRMVEAVIDGLSSKRPSPSHAHGQ